MQNNPTKRAAGNSYTKVLYVFVPTCFFSLELRSLRIHLFPAHSASCLGASHLPLECHMRSPLELFQPFCDIKLLPRSKVLKVSISFWFDFESTFWGNSRQRQLRQQ